MKDQEDQGAPIHHAASEGYTRSADTYARGRPGYAPELVGWLRASVGLQEGKKALDLGAGTGKFTPRLVETGAAVIAVEPVAEMAAKLAAALPQVRVLTGTAERVPLPDASVDAVVCAQAFHWFANRAALDEIHRVLAPGGRLALVWNMRDARVDWVARLDAIVNQYEGDAPRYYTGAWRKVFPHPGFSPFQEAHFSIEHSGPPEDVIVGRVLSTSFIAALPEDERARVEAKVRELVASEPLLAGRATVGVPYETAAFVATRVD